MQPGKCIKGWFTKRSSDASPVEYSNYEGLSNDPLAGSSASSQNASFSAGGTETGGLGIAKGHTANLFDQIVAEREKPNFNGFLGKLNYFWSGGHVDGVSYNKNGEAIGLSPSMGIAGEMIGGFGSSKYAVAKLSSSAAKLNKHYKFLQKYGKGGYKHLQNGRTRYYNQARQNIGDENLWRTVKELNPINGITRIWHETLGPSGKVIQVRPELGEKYRHYGFDKLENYLGWW